MELELISYSIVQDGHDRYLEGLFAPLGFEDDPKEFVQFRVSISPEGYPRTLEALLEGLKSARDAIGQKTRELSALQQAGH